MWGRGDKHEAVRWLRRAAEAASDAGSDMRALSLARSAADLTQALELPPSIAPPPVASVTQVSASAPAAPSSQGMTPVPTPVAVRPAPPPIAPLSPDEATTPRPVPVSRPKAPPLSAPDEATVHDFTIPAGVEAAERRQPPPSRRPPPPVRSSPNATQPMRSSPSAAPPSVRSSPSAAPPPVRSSPSAAPPPVRSSPSAAPPSDPHTSRSSPSMAPAPTNYRPRQALRVAVTPAPDDKNLMLVRALADDELVPPGAHEALLTALEAGVHLTGKKR